MRPTTFHLGSSLALAALALAPACFRGADVSKIVCGDDDHCPAGYTCRVAAGSSQGRCEKPAGSGNADGGLADVAALPDGGLSDTPLRADGPPAADGLTASGGAGGTGGAPSGGGAGAGGTRGLGGSTMADAAAGAGGLANTGGMVSTGGSSVGPATGGIIGTGGGGPVTGGAVGTGGRPVTGGAIGSGGVGTGGVAASGGVGTGGGPATGGVIGSGGTIGTGGRPATGGAVGTGGVAGTGGGTGTSAGCNAATVPAACSQSGSPCNTVVNGKMRTYYVQLPANYSSATPYPVVFQFHPMGGTAEQAMTIYNLRSQMPEAIYVSPQGLLAGSSTGWSNTGGEDIELTKTILATVQASYCVNNARVFSVGFSYGAMMSFAIGCELGGTFRAIAPMSGALWSGCKAGTKPIAMWGTHGLSDTVVPLDNGRDARDEFLSRNQCGTTTVNTSPSPCVSYEGCAIGYPVTWCEFDGSHSLPSWSSSAIVAFFGQFP